MKTKKDYKVVIPRRNTDFVSEDAKAMSACTTAIADCLPPAFTGCGCVFEGIAITEPEEDEE